MFKALAAKWCTRGGDLSPKTVGEKVKFFFNKFVHVYLLITITHSAIFCLFDNINDHIS